MYINVTFAHHISQCSSMVRASHRRSEGYGLDSRQGLRKFFWVKLLENAYEIIKYCISFRIRVVNCCHLKLKYFKFNHIRHKHRNLITAEIRHKWYWKLDISKYTFESFAVLMLSQIQDSTSHWQQIQHEPSMFRVWRKRTFYHCNDRLRWPK